MYSIPIILTCIVWQSKLSAKSPGTDGEQIATPVLTASNDISTCNNNNVTYKNLLWFSLSNSKTSVPMADILISLPGELERTALAGKRLCCHCRKVHGAEFAWCQEW